MRRLFILLWIFTFSSVQADEVTIQWQHDKQPAGVTYELQVGESTTTGISDLQHTMDVPTGEPIDIRVRAVPPSDHTDYSGPSEWATLTAVVPANQTGLDVMARGYIEVPWETKPDLAQTEVDWEDSINEGLKSWWLFNEGTGGTLYDIVGHNHGTLTNMDPSTDWIPGEIGSALDFDGVDDYVSTSNANSMLFSASTVTISAWVFPKGIAISGARADLGGGAVGDTGGYIGIYRTNISGTDNIWAQNYDGNSDWVGVSYNPNEWTHIVLIHNGGNLYIYKNGVLGGSVASGNTTNLTNSMNIGRGYNASGKYFQGIVDDVRIYNRALSASEVQEIYQNPLGGIKPRRQFYVIPGGISAIQLTVQDMAHAQSLDAISLSQANVLQAADSLHLLTMDDLALTQANTLSVNEYHHTQEIESIALIQANLMTLAGLFHDHLSANIELTQASTLAPQEIDHGHSIDSAELTQANLIAVADSFHDHRIGTLDLSQIVSLITPDLSHSLEIDPVALLQANTLATDETIHGHSLDSITLTQANALAIATILHDLLVDNVELTVSGALASLPPDAILESTNLSGTVSDIQDDPDTPDASWLTTIDNAFGTDVRVSFPSPSGTPTVGTDRQEFRVLVRRSGPSGNGTPDCTVTLYESGAPLAATTTLTAFTAAQVIALPWDASLLTGADGSSVECRVQGTTNGGGINRRTVDIGAIEWNADTGAPSETLIIGDAMHAHTMDNAVLSQANALAIAELLHSQSIEAIALIQANLLEMADSFHDYLINTLELSQALSLVSEDTSHDVSTEPITLTQANTLAVDETGHLHSLETLSLIQASTIAPADSQHDHLMEAVSLLVGGALDVSDLSHSISLDDLSLTQASLLSVAEIQHSHTTDEPVLSQAQTIALSDSQHSQSVDNVTLSEALILAVGDSQHSQSIDSAALLQAGTLIVQALLHSHSLEFTNLVQANTLIVSAPLHGQTLDSPDLDFSQAVIVQDMGHLQSMESPTLNQAAVLSINESRHLHTLERPFLIQTNALIVDELYHVHIIEQSGLAVGFIVTPANPSIKINAADLTARIRSENLSITLH